MSAAELLGLGPKRTARLLEDGRYEIEVTPPTFMKSPPQKVILTRIQYLKFIEWLNGKGLIQNQLPELSASDREKLLSGLGDEEFDALAEESDADEEEEED